MLSDPKKKARYDSGQDLEEMDAHGFHGNLNYYIRRVVAIVSR